MRVGDFELESARVDFSPGKGTNHSAWLARTSAAFIPKRGATGKRTDTHCYLAQVTTKLAEVFGNEWKSKKFAVRSSAVGEDSEEMSAAGQMTTFLGIHGERALSSSIVNCWASQFALTGRANIYDQNPLN